VRGWGFLTAADENNIETFKTPDGNTDTVILKKSTGKYGWLDLRWDECYGPYDSYEEARRARDAFYNVRLSA
jgi:hypothetical protein